MTYCRVEQELNDYLDKQDQEWAQEDEEREMAFLELAEWVTSTMDSSEVADRGLCATVLSESDEFEYLVNLITRVDPHNEHAEANYAKAARAMAEHISKTLPEYK